MAEDPGNPKVTYQRLRRAAGIGGPLGFLAGLGIYKLIGFDSFWLLMVIAICSNFLGIVLAQKIASR